MQTLTKIFIVLAVLLIIYFVSKRFIKSRRMQRHRDIQTPLWTSEVAEAVVELQTEPERATDHAIAGRLLRYNRLENNPHMDINAANDVFNEFTRAMLEMTDEEIPFILDEATILEQDALWATIDNGPANRFHTTWMQVYPQQQQHTKEVAAKIKKESKTAKEAVTKLDKEMRKIKSDPQNVHDSKVNSSLRDTLVKLKKTYKANIDCVADAKQFIKGRADEAKCLQTLQQIEKNAPIMTYADTELNIFSYVWERCYLRDNIAASHDMKTAIADALSDCVEGDHLVCINGRCGRLLASLVLLDHDPSISVAMTFDALKNQIYGETKDIIDAELAKYEKGSDETKRTFAKIYKEGGECDPEVEKVFISDVKKLIDANLKEYNDKLTAIELQKLRTDCYAYVEMV